MSSHSRTRCHRRRLPNAVVTLVVLATIMAGGGCAGSPDTGGSVEPEPPPTAPADGATRPLEPGDLLPPLAAEGWLNGQPPTPSNPGVRLLVVDVRGDWCPYCRDSAPDLVGVYQRYATRSVAFVSLTDMPRVSAEGIARNYSIPWAIGYRTSPATLTALGVGSGMTGPGYDVAPTLYLVGSDGRVRWSDGQGRFRHTPPKEWARQLDQAIEAALGAGPVPPAMGAPPPRIITSDG
jgi:thiol-disulfide isomerase/thioredoxin